MTSMACVFAGGGIIEMHIGGEIEVSGYIQANAKTPGADTLSGGGSGGSILIFTTNYTGMIE